MTAYHQIKRRITKRQLAALIVYFHNTRTERREIPARHLNIRRPGLRRGQRRWACRNRRQHLTAASLQVQRCRTWDISQSGHPGGKHPGVTPRRTLLDGTALEPGEIPAAYRYRRPFSHKIFKAGHDGDSARHLTHPQARYRAPPGELASRSTPSWPASTVPGWVATGECRTRSTT